MNRPIHQCFLKSSFTELDKKMFKEKSAFLIRKLICHSGYCKYCKQSRKNKLESF